MKDHGSIILVVGGIKACHVDDAAPETITKVSSEQGRLSSILQVDSVPRLIVARKISDL